MKYRASAIIVNYNSWEDTKRILSKLPEDIETIVVDNASHEFHELPANRVIRNALNVGFAKALNQGMELATTDFVFVITPDTDFERELLYTLLDFMHEHEDVAVVVPQGITPKGNVWPMARKIDNPFMFLFGRRSILRFMGSSKDFLYLKVNEPTEVQAIVGTLALFRKKAVMEVGGFDERFFFYCEDLDISKRLREKGWKLYMLPNLHFTHHVGRRSFFAEFKRAKSFFMFFVKNYKLFKVLRLPLMLLFFAYIYFLGFREIFLTKVKDPGS